jgi:antirestriction protein ArdC
MEWRQKITDEIVARIEAGGLPPWRQGWTSAQAAINPSTGDTAYRGINQLILRMQPFSDCRWLTLVQANKLGYSVRKGEKGTSICKVVDMPKGQADRAREKGDAEVLGEDGKMISVLKTYTVFNASQIEGMPPLVARPTDIKPAEAIEAMVWGMQDTGMKLNFGGSEACYRPQTDELRMPVAADFENQDFFNGVLLHELAHATGHERRISRPLTGKFGSAEYAREELRAELASAMGIGGVCGLPLSSAMIDSHAGYVASWLHALKNDKFEIFRAAADAQKICDYLAERALAAKPKMAAHLKSQVRPVVDEPVLARAPMRPKLG